jgi:hypothetical protein
VEKEAQMRAGGLQARVRYGVFPLERQWLLCCETHRLGRYIDLPSAVYAGRRAAREAMGSGFEAELYILGVGGELRRDDPAAFGH